MEWRPKAFESTLYVLFKPKYKLELEYFEILIQFWCLLKSQFLKIVVSKYVKDHQDLYFLCFIGFIYLAPVDISRQWIFTN